MALSPPRLPERPLSARTPWPSKCSGWSLEARWESLVNRPDFGRALRADAMLAVEATGDVALKGIHQACRRKSERASIDSRFDGDSGITAMEGEASLLRSAVYVDCLMATDPRRFCEAPHRKDLVGALRSHLALMGRVRNEWRFFSAARQLQTGPAAESGPGDGEIRSSPTCTSSRPDYPSSKVDARIVDGLKELAEHGFVSASDFGWFGLSIPAGLEPSLQHVETTVDGCRT